VPEAGQGSGANAIAVGLLNPAAYCLSANPLGKTVCAERCWIGANKNASVAIRGRDAKLSLTRVRRCDFDILW